MGHAMAARRGLAGTPPLATPVGGAEVEGLYQRPRPSKSSARTSRSFSARVRSARDWSCMSRITVAPFGRYSASSFPQPAHRCRATRGD